MNDLVPMSDAEKKKFMRFLARGCPDIDELEFVQVMKHVHALGLDIYRRQVHVWRDRDGRIVIHVGIDGFRAIANGSGNYRPDPEGGHWVVDEKLKGPQNPAGLVSATFAGQKFVHGEWSPHPHTVHWTAYAPIYGDQPIKQRSRWAKDPHGMLMKCAEAGSIRKGFSALSGVYASEELEKGMQADIELEPNEYKETPPPVGSVRIRWTANGDLVDVPMDGLHAQVMAKFKDWSPADRVAWYDSNKPVLGAYWENHKARMLEWKPIVEAARKTIEEGAA